MSDRGKLLLLGASGLLGRHVRELLGRSHYVATFRSHAIDGGVLFDAATSRLRDSLLRGTHGFRAALILYGITKLDACASDAAGSARINVESIQRTIDDLVDAGVKPIFASSDAVFDGATGMREEADATRPLLTYGKQKLAVESYLGRLKVPWVVARLSKLVSIRPEPRNLLNEWADQLESGQLIRCARELVFSPADVDDAARALIRLADDAFSGVYHVCGPKPVRRLDLLNLLLSKIEERRVVRPRIMECGVRDLPFIEPRPLDVSMRPDKLYAALGTPFRGMEAVCADFAANRYSVAAAKQVRPV